MLQADKAAEEMISRENEKLSAQKKKSKAAEEEEGESVLHKVLLACVSRGSMARMWGSI